MSKLVESLKCLFFKEPKPAKVPVKQSEKNMNMRLANQNYDAFCKAFYHLVDMAQKDDDVRDYVYCLHNKITNGATERIFQNGGLELEHLRVTEANFKRYLNSNELDIAQFMANQDDFSLSGGA